MRVSIETEPLAEEALAGDHGWEVLVDAVLERLEADTAVIGSVGIGRHGTLGAVFTVETATVGDAARAGIEVFERSLGGAGAQTQVLRLELEVK